jgi:hypothetical protein
MVGRGKIMRDNACYSKIKKNCILGMSSGVRPQKGHLTPEVKVAMK